MFRSSRCARLARWREGFICRFRCFAGRGSIAVRGYPTGSADEIARILTMGIQQRHKGHKGMRLCLLSLLWLIPAPQYTYRVVKSYPHDHTSFTQGLEYRDGFLYEGTGLVGRSAVRKIDLATGHVLQNFDVPRPFFGEGITV